MNLDTHGRNWGGDDPGRPAGRRRLPTLSSYGFNEDVVGQLTPPALIMNDLDDVAVPGGAASAAHLYRALPASMANKVLVQLDCATHEMMWEGCSDVPRCVAAREIPYGTDPGKPWGGAHSTVTAVLIEWINNGTFDGAQAGSFTVDGSGVARAGGS